MAIFSWLKHRRLDLDEEEFREEIRAHLAIEINERTADGEDPEAARYAALRDFGNVTLTTEAIRHVWTPAWLEYMRRVASDVRYAVRSLAKNPAFSLTVIGVLTLGIGLNAAVFTMIKALALSPIAGVDGSAHLAVVFGESNTGRPLRLSYADYQYLRDNDRAFTGLFGSTVGTVGLGRGRASRAVWTEFVTGNYFQILDVGPALGRTILPSDEGAPGRNPVVVISEGLWRRDFARDPEIVGKTIDINSRPMTVIGVADRGFHGTTVVYDVELFIPVTMAPEFGFSFGSQQVTPAGILADRNAIFFYPVGYLRPGTTYENGAARTSALWQSLLNDRPLIDAAVRTKVVPFRQMPNGAASYILPTLVVVSIMGLLVLMIACANIAGLVLVRGVSRRGEIAVRLALGATRTRILRLLLVENLVLALPGAFCGVLLARYGLPVLVGYAEALAAPQRIFFNTELDGFVMAFTALITCGSALLSGFAPALQSSRVDLVRVINEDASPRGASRGRLRAALVVSQVAVSLLLLVGAGLVTRTLEAARSTHPGFEASDVVSISLDVKQVGYGETRGRAFYRQLLDTLRADSAVEAAAVATYEPMNLLETRAQRVALEGYDSRADEDLTLLSNVISAAYFRTLRIPLAAGREFDDRDDENGRPVVIVNRTLAEHFWGGPAKALGKRLRVAGGDWRTVVGVASDVKYLRINEGPRPYLYLPLLQAYRPSMILHARPSANFGSLSTAAATQTFIDRVREHVVALDSDLPVEYGKSMTERLTGAMIFFNLSATMLTIFGMAGMLLAGLGTYGLVSYVVKQSTHETGIRLALGASSLSVVRRFLARGVLLGGLGAGVGVIAAIGAGHFLRSVLFGVSPTDTTSFAGALAIVIGGVLIATVIPAWRASRTDPLKALRHP